MKSAKIVEPFCAVIVVLKAAMLHLVARGESRLGRECLWLRYGFSTGSRTALPHSVHDPS